MAMPRASLRLRVVPAMLIVLSGSLIAPTSARAQLNAGRIVGTVSDPSHAAVPRATVVVTDTATGLSVTVTTNDRGDFVVTPLNPRVYRVSVCSNNSCARVRTSSSGSTSA